MIFWGQKQVRIFGGDFKEKRVDINLIYSKDKPFPVHTEDLKADGGFIEIKKAIEIANGGTPNVGQV